MLQSAIESLLAALPEIKALFVFQNMMEDCNLLYRTPI
jgi:hypothetical protein